MAPCPRAVGGYVSGSLFGEVKWSMQCMHLFDFLGSHVIWPLDHGQTDREKHEAQASG
jgi:hypothetical protein